MVGESDQRRAAILHKCAKTDSEDFLYFLLMVRGRPNGNRRAARPARRGNGTEASLALAPLFRTPTSIDHHFVRRYEFGTLGRLTADRGFAFSFALSDLPNSNEFTSLYDLYRLDFVEIIVENAALTTSSFTVGSPALPTLIIYPDYTDSGAPASISEANESALAERITMSYTKSSVSRRIKPMIPTAVATNLTGTLAGAYAMPARHLSCVFPSVPHFGIKMFVANYNTVAVEDSGAILNVSFRYGLTMRNPR